jgi:hypothetical protein
VRTTAAATNVTSTAECAVETTFVPLSATSVVSMSHTDIEVTFVARGGSDPTPTQPPLTFVSHRHGVPLNSGFSAAYSSRCRRCSES